MEDIGAFFDDNNFYDQQISQFDFYFMKFIKNHQLNDSTLSDIGGGSGNFSNLITDNCPNVNVTILDPSKKLLSKIKNPKITKIVGKLPDEIPLDCNYNFIHIKEVMHHITGNTVYESNKLLKDSLICVNKLLN